MVGSCRHTMVCLSQQSTSAEYFPFVEIIKSSLVCDNIWKELHDQKNSYVEEMAL